MTEPAAHNPKYVAAIAVIAGAILLVGALLRPQPDAATSAAPPPSETDLLRLARLSQRRTLENMTEYFSSVADEAAKSLRYVADVRTTAVVWSPDQVISPWHESTTVPGPQLPLVVAESPAGSALTPANRAASLLRSSDWVVAVWQGAASRAYAPGNYLQTIEVACEGTQVREVLSTIALTPTMAGGGLFDGEGRLLAVLLRCGERLAAIDTTGVATMLEYSRSDEGRLLAEFGFRASQPALDEAAHFKITSGVLVREVWDGRSAAIADLRPGDVVSADDLRRLLSSASAAQTALFVKRGSRMVNIGLSRTHGDAEANSGPPDAGMVWEAPRRGYPIESVVPGSAADKAGIRSGDVLLRINHLEPKDLTQVRRLLAGRGSKTAFVELVRDGRTLGVLVF